MLRIARTSDAPNAASIFEVAAQRRMQARLCKLDDHDTPAAMSILIPALLLTMQSAAPGDCVYNAVAPAARSSIGAAIVAKRPRSDADIEALKDAVDQCARPNRWSIDSALHANGSAAMRFAADTLANQLGHPTWSANALAVLRKRPRDQVQNLAKTGSGNAEFEIVLTHMLHSDPAIEAALKGASDEAAEKFILMVKLTALSEVERLAI